MSFFSKWPFSRASVPADSVAPADQLRAEITALEQEMLDSQRTLTDLETRSREIETRAIEAIRAGDDWAARTVLLEQHSLAEKAALLTAELRVMRAILDECYEVADATPERPEPRP